MTLDGGGKVLVPNLAIKGLIDQHCPENGIEPPSVPDFAEDGSSGKHCTKNREALLNVTGTTSKGKIINYHT